MSVTAVIQHRVKDYDAWHRAYDGSADAQKRGGVTHESVHRSNGDPSNVLVIHGFRSVWEAEAFLIGPRIRDTMLRAGVDGKPRIEIYEDV